MSTTPGRVGVLTINFGEPEEPRLETVRPFLERIFLSNAGLEPDQAARKRARQLAEERAPGLVEEYRAIGGSPLNEQADAQTEQLQTVLRRREWDVRTYAAFQFTPPSIDEKIREAREDRVETLVALPVYPLCGQTTTVAALDAVRAAMAEIGWHPRFVAVAGWHYHPAYVLLRTEHIREFATCYDLDPSASDTLLYFSAHGTPIKYLADGSRYDRYVEEHCYEVARRLGVARHAVGFQNHTNRRICWTQPDNEDRIRAADERRLIVVPISFMHEQSETLAELDRELKEYAEELGKEFHRVPVPHDAPEFVEFLADLVEAVVTKPERAASPLTSCRCVPAEGVWCTNGARDLPPSRYVGTRG